MQNPFKKRPTPLDHEIAAVSDALRGMSLDDPNYHKTMKTLRKLMELKANTARKPVSSDTMLMVGGNLVLALLILGFERGHALTSKALSLLMRRS